MILVTGANGFIGGAVIARAVAESMPVRGSHRRSVDTSVGTELVATGEISDSTDWRTALRGVDVVVHTAARVHVMRDRDPDGLNAFRRTNVAGTLRLAEQARDAGVRRFVFISSIKVNGESTAPGRPYNANDPPAPLDPYGVSKQEAESALRGFAANGAMDVVIIRPVLVYGPGVRANFRALMKLVWLGVPLPFGGIDNKRSLVALDNLVDLIFCVTREPAAANKTFLVSDDFDSSTPDLVRQIAQGMERSPRLVAVPPWFLEFAGRITGAAAPIARLCTSLQVDIGMTKETLGWRPIVSREEALRKTAQAFLAEAGR